MKEVQPQFIVSVGDIIPLPKCALPKGTKVEEYPSCWFTVQHPDKEELEAVKLKPQNKEVKTVERNIRDQTMLQVGQVFKRFLKK